MDPGVKSRLGVGGEKSCSCASAGTRCHLNLGLCNNQVDLIVNIDHITNLIDDALTLAVSMP